MPLWNQNPTVDTRWYDLPLATNWSNYGNDYPTAQYRKLSATLVQIKGVIKRLNTATVNEVVGTLPTGYIPSEIMTFSTSPAPINTILSRIYVDTSGNVRFNGGASTSVAINCIFGI